jgi:hypothetical protein
MKKPFINALSAAVYIVLIVLGIFSTTVFFPDAKETIVIPMAMLSLFVLSAAVMGYLFVAEPIYLLVDNKKKEAVEFFAKTVGFFACFLLLFLFILVLTNIL